MVSCDANIVQLKYIKSIFSIMCIVIFMHPVEDFCPISLTFFCMPTMSYFYLCTLPIKHFFVHLHFFPVSLLNILYPLPLLDIICCFFDQFNPHFSFWSLLSLLPNAFHFELLTPSEILDLFLTILAYIYKLSQSFCSMLYCS